VAALPGQTNAYYNVDPLGTQNETLTFEDCRSLASAGKEPAIRDDRRADLKQRPWAEKQAYEVVSSEAPGNPWRAFKLRVVGPSADPALFTNEKQPLPLGATFRNPDENVRRAYDDTVRAWPPPRPKAATESRQKVWWPTATKPDQQNPGVFAELKQLLKEVNSGDEILIHHTGDLPLDTEEIKAATKPGESDVRLTFKPANNFRPILVVKEDNDLNQTLFKLKAGEVTFEDIEFRLKPNRPRDAQVVAAVSVIGGKGVAFRNCVFTLAEEDDSRVAVVHLPDSVKEMAMDPTRPVPKISFDHCLVRGKGRAVWIEVSRPFALEMTDSLTALDGPVIAADAGGKLSGGTASSAKLTRVTVLAGGSVAELHGGKVGDPKGAGLVKLDVEADGCLFVAVPGAGRPLVEVEGVDPADVKSVLTWQVKKANWYANFDPLAALAVIRPGGDGTPREWTRDDWVGSVGEPAAAEKRFGAITFAMPISGLKDLAIVRPADLIVKAIEFTDLSDPAALIAGVELKSLPTVRAEPKSE
jgi:hypothetical protein